MHRNPIYDPREDSFLLAEAVKVYAFGKTLDMGTGSGIQAFSAAGKKEVESVLAVDINTDALVEAKKRHMHPLISYRQSDLFSEITEKFDTIIFNPPYLPDDPDVCDIALDGGKKGYELSVRFLKDARNHLSDDGQILFLFSSLTDKNAIETALIENTYIFEEILAQKIDFEKLYVYRITKIESLVKGVEGISFFSKGKRGLIYTGKKDSEKVAIKIKNPASEAGARILIEGKNLNDVNMLGIGPKLIEAEEDYLIYKFVEGVPFPEFLGKSEKKQEIIGILIQIFSQMRTLDLAKTNKEEMTNPYKHILITDDMKAVLIDFERANKDLNPHNVNQFIQYLISEKLGGMLKEKKIIIDREKILSLAKEYKKDYNEETYRKILECIK